jgi:hypothetical protein
MNVQLVRDIEPNRKLRRVLGWVWPLGVRISCQALAFGLLSACERGEAAEVSVVREEARPVATKLVRQAGDADDWAKLVAELQSSEFARRDAASKKLGAGDFSAMVQVLPLLTASDAELAWRAKEVMIQQGIRGSDAVIRRIGLVLQLLTAAGYPQFAEDAEKFESRVVALRILEATRRLETIPGVSVSPGPQIQGMMAGGNVFRIQGGVVIGQAPIEIRGRGGILQPNAGGVQIIEMPADFPPPGLLEPNRTEPTTPDPANPKTISPESEALAGSDAEIRRAYLREKLSVWLEKCVTADVAELTKLEEEWRATGLIGAGNEGTEQTLTQYFDITISQTLDAEQTETLRNFLQNPISVMLNMHEVVMSLELQSLLAETAAAGKIAYLNTYRCSYNLDTYVALSESLKEGRLGNWYAQGRALIGIQSGSILAGRVDATERGGALVSEVSSNSAASEVGILAGDVIRRINGIPVENFEELRRIVAAFDVGDTIKVELSRSGLDSLKAFDVKLKVNDQQPR